jgi:hypothetical protein
MKVKLESGNRTLLDMDIWFLIVSYMFARKPYTPIGTAQDLKLTVDGVEIPYSLIDAIEDDE